jgi:sigma-B regulation protein RsbU (phosphoserine phosphatase)
MPKRKSETVESSLASSYLQALEELRQEGAAASLLQPMSELAALLDVTSTLGSGTDGDEMLDAALGLVLRALRAERGALFVRNEDGVLALRASRALPPAAPSKLDLAESREALFTVEPGDQAHDRHGLVLLVRIDRHDRLLAVLGLGPREGRLTYGTRERAFLRSVAACAAAPIESGLLRAELRRVRQKLSVKVVELRNLFDIGRDLSGSSADETIQDRVITTVMGHFVVSRCALYLLGPRGLSVSHERGLRRDVQQPPIPPDEAREGLSGFNRSTPVAELPEGPLRHWLERDRMALAVPLSTGERLDGILAIGERASGTAFSVEDGEIAEALARQAATALENARLQRIRDDKLRQDRELQIAREIQRSLLPPQPPQVRGFDVAGESRPCYEVGGDCYDWIPLAGERLALVVADVAGKGTPASLLMASVHAFVHALAGTAAPAQLIERLNRFLLARTQASRFVTLFYAEVDAAEQRLVYVNAGHVPPSRVARDGTVSRLSRGGPALGLLPDEAYEVGELLLGPGDVIAMVTDGVTEAMSPDEREFGDDRVNAVLRRLSGQSSASILSGLVAAVHDWAEAPSFSDDLTALILKAR